ncbi:myrosinase 1-like [Melitaea cinxia]|uniref:myrosinase 1-like n=1 Tax=Melitaea cinxia TaxID=113334 RepID=UPI001E2711B5|nr:myrosinase 1-like [Melitaea cinxia]
MWGLKAVATSLLVCSVLGARNFPPDFKFGSASSAYQVEGAWNYGDKTPSIWDVFIKKYPNVIIDNSNADIACNSFHDWERDVKMARELGLDYYRFSISWPRILPTGKQDRISEYGKKYYNDLINALLENGIKPVVTMYHWDLPQALQDWGGWLNPLITDWFENYARVLYSLFGDRVKTWLTLNEPLIFCELSFNTGKHPPGLLSAGQGNYVCNKNAMLAHAKAWRVYDKEFREKQRGKVSLANQYIWLEPHTDSEIDVEATKIARQLMIGMYTHPIFSKDGGWPPVIERIVAEKSKKEGRFLSRLPGFTQEEIEVIKGTYDFLGINYYTARTVNKVEDGVEVGEWPLLGSSDLDIQLTTNDKWNMTDASWLFEHPVGFRRLLNWLKNEYGDIDILITENGYATNKTIIDDQARVKYMEKHLEQVLLTINEDKIKVIGYTAWSMMDNFEWCDGYSLRFGLYEVDFKDPKLKHKPRASAHYYTNVIKHRSLDFDDKISNIITGEL